MTFKVKKPFSLKHLKQWFQGRLNDGAICPVCDRYAKIYNRKLNANMADILICIYKIDRKDEPENGWFRVTEAVLEYKRNSLNQEYSKLRWWGLLEQKRQAKEDGNPCSGYWRITDRGRDFVRMKAVVPRTILMFNNKFLGFEKQTDTITINQALGDKFDYNELMRS